MMDQLCHIPAQLEESDFEGTDPPAGVWEQIARPVALVRAAVLRGSRGTANRTAVPKCHREHGR